MTTSESWSINRHVRCRPTSPVFVVSQCKLVSGWGLRNWAQRHPMGLVAREGLYTTTATRHSNKCYLPVELLAWQPYLAVPLHWMLLAAVASTANIKFLTALEFQIKPLCRTASNSDFNCLAEYKSWALVGSRILTLIPNKQLKICC